MRKTIIPSAFAVLLAIAGASRADDGPALDVPPTAEPLRVSLAAPAEAAKDAAGSALRLVEVDGGGSAPIPASLVDDRGPDGLPIAGRKRLTATIPPAERPRRFRLETTDAPAASSFRIADIDDRSLGIWEGDKPVLVYNHGVINREGVPAGWARSGYVHPLYGLDGEVLTDDFPRDHYHHRGLFWAWPHVLIDGKEYDLWALRGIRHQFERWLDREAGEASATLGVESGWYVGDRRVMIERVWIDVHPAAGDARAIDLALTLTPDGHPVTLGGAEGKSYGGLNLRYAPGPDRKITTPLGDGPDDLLMTRLPWADLSERFAGDRTSGAALFVTPDHPDFPPTWLTRHYGVLCVGWPGVTPKTLEPSRPTTLRYRVWIHRGPADADGLARVAKALAVGQNLDWAPRGADRP